MNKLSSTLALLLLATTTQTIKVDSETETETAQITIPGVSDDPDTVFGSLLAAQSGENWAGVAKKVDQFGNKVNVVDKFTEEFGGEGYPAKHLDTCYKQMKIANAVVATQTISCPSGYDNIGGICYQQCASGSKRSGLGCASECGSGTSDKGWYCSKKKSCSWKKKKRGWVSYWKRECKYSGDCAGGKDRGSWCEKKAGTLISKTASAIKSPCPAGSKEGLLNTCEAVCDSSWENFGFSCVSGCPANTTHCGILCLGEGVDCTEKVGEVTDKVIDVAISATASLAGIGALFLAKDVADLADAIDYPTCSSADVGV